MRRNKLFPALVIILALMIAAQTALIIRQSGRTDTPSQIHVIIDDSSDNRWVQFIEGMEQAAEDEVMTAMSSVEIHKAIHDLPEPSREVLYLRLLADLSFRQIGEIFGKSEEWARVTFYRGKLRLRKELGDEHDE